MSGLNLLDHGMREPFTLHRAAWLVPVRVSPIADGAVLVRGNTILAAGSFREVMAGCPAGIPQMDHGSAALMPGLVNAHTHLELSALKDRIPLPQESFASWLGHVFSQRVNLPPQVQEQGFREGMCETAEVGVVLCGDITNGAQFGSNFESGTAQRQVFLELLGFDREALETFPEADLLGAFMETARADTSLSLAAHACYSTSAQVIRKAKEWSRMEGRPFSIHTAEHPEEIEFLQTGTGFCREILESLGRWVPDWTPPRTTPIQYLTGLGVLDQRTLLVHAVHMTESDWDTVAANRCPVCFCPRSNHNLNAGRADIGAALRRGITAALGTDSLASNTDLNLFAEAAFVMDHYPDIPPRDLLAMMTLGGAAVLQRGTDFGSIEPGKRATLLAVSLPDSLPASQLEETIIHHGKKGEWRWAHHPRNN